MVLVDANVLLYAVNEDACQHEVARSWLTAEQAGAILEAWLQSPHAVPVEPTLRHLPVLRGLLSTSGTAGNLVSDAHLAALALEHDATIVSFDRDFARFEGVRWRLPGS